MEKNKEKGKKKRGLIATLFMLPLTFLRHAAKAVISFATFLKSLLIILVFLVLICAVLFVLSGRVRSLAYDLVVERRFDVIPDMLAYFRSGEPMEIVSEEDRIIRTATVRSILSLQNEEFQRQTLTVNRMEKALNTYESGDSILISGMEYTYEELERDCRSRREWRSILWKRIKDNERLLKRIQEPEP